MSVDKLVDSTQLDSDLTSVANAIRTKGGTSAQLAFPSGFVSAIQNIPTGGGGGSVTQDEDGYIILPTEGGGDGGKWKRPAEWSDYSKLNLIEDEEEAVYLTYDNRTASIAQEVIGLYAYTSVNNIKPVLQRVSIGSDGTVTVLDSVEMNRGSDFQTTIPTDAGDFVCYRINCSGAHITEFAFGSPASGGLWYVQKCVEIYANLPYCTNYKTTSAYRGSATAYTQSITYLSTPSAGFISVLSYCQSLRNLPTDGWSYMSSNLYGNMGSVFTYSRLTDFDFSVLSFASATTISSLFQFSSELKSIDMSMCSISGVTNISSLASNCTSLEWFRSPTRMDSVTNTSDIFSRCYQLKVAEFDSSLTIVSGRSFDMCHNMQALILRSTSMVTLENVAAVQAFMRPGGGFLFVPQSVLATYQSGTNWSTVASYIKPIEGSYWETHHADGSVIS